MLEAACSMETLEKRQGLKIYCPEEIAFRLNYINAEDLKFLSETIPDKSYANYLKQIIKPDNF